MNLLQGSGGGDRWITGHPGLAHIMERSGGQASATRTRKPRTPPSSAYSSVSAWMQVRLAPGRRSTHCRTTLRHERDASLS